MEKLKAITLGEYMHLRFPALRKIPKNALEGPFLAVLGLKMKKPDEEPALVTSIKPTRSKEEQPELDSLLLKKIEDNDYKNVEEALEQGADPNAKMGVFGRTIFTLAVRGKAKMDIIELLIARGADVDAKDENNDTPLIHATSKSRLDAVNALLAKGADPHAKNKKGKNALDYAERLKLEKTAQTLRDCMRAKASLEQAAEEKETRNEQLIEAAKSRNLEMVKEALEKGADIDARDKGPLTFGRTALMWAAENNFMEIAEFLVRNHADANARDKIEVTALILAARMNYIDMAELLLKNNADVNARMKSGETAIGWATTKSHQKMVALLLSNGAIELDQPTISMISRNPIDQAKLDKQLLESAEKSDWDAAKKALERGAKVNTRDEDGWTVLAFAACAGNLEVAEIALEKGADVDSSDNGGRTPLMHAARKGHYNLVAFLLNRGADPNAQSNHVEDAVSFARKGEFRSIEVLLLSDRGSQEGVSRRVTLRMAAMPDELLEGRADEESAVRPDPDALLLESVKSGEMGKLIGALEKGAKPDVTDSEGWTPLMHLANAGNADGVSQLVQKGADVNRQNLSNETALDLAIQRKRLDIEAILRENGGKTKQMILNSSLVEAAQQQNEEAVCQAIAGGAEIDARDGNEMTALMSASAAGNIAIVRILIDNNAKMDLKNADGMTTLMLAAGNGHRDVAEFLLLSGADTKAKDKSGKTVFDLASAWENGGIADMIGKAERKIQLNSLLIPAIIMGSNEGVAALLEQGADPNSKDGEGKLPIIEAISDHNEDLVKLLVIRGADPNLQDSNGWTALKHAAAKGIAPIAEMLITIGAKIDAEDAHGRTPLMEAAYYGHLEIVRLLISNNADAAIRDKSGKSALDHSLKNRNPDIARILQKCEF